MLTLYPVFSDNALFQASSRLTLRGTADAEVALSAAVTKNGTTVSEGHTAACADGTFSLTLNTPPASFDTYEITLTGSGETAVLHNILFGELWIATGQSNMEMANYHQPECPQMLDAIKEYPIRVYNIAYQKDGADPEQFSYTPENDTPGKWLSASCDDLTWVSACATAFCRDVAAYFRDRGREVPVGFLNVSWGGTPCYGWIPMDILKNDARVMQLLEKQGRLPLCEKYNSFGGGNFQQPAAMYNRKIAPVRGLRARGVLWYQGENEVGIEWNERIYAHLLRLLYGNFQNEFAADTASFPFLSVLIYPWVYGGSGETMRGYVNEAFVETAKAEPEKFIICPIDDLPPVWAANLDNHPIHPAHKYRVGARMAKLALANVYGNGGQRAPATLDSCEISGSRMILHFADVGCGLEVRGGHIDGLYIAGADGHYLPAECEILSADTMAVWHPYLDDPVHCAYDISSFACGANLWAGDYPAAPFATAIKEPGQLNIEAMPFLNPDITRVWEAHIDASGRLDVYYHPVWKPLAGCEVCQDDAFAETISGMMHSVRVSAETVSSGSATFGAYVSSTEYHRIRLSRFSAMEIDLYHRGTVSGYLEIGYAPKDGMTVTVQRPLAAIDGAPYTFQRYKADLAGIPEGIIETLKFVFTVDDPQKMNYVNVSKITLK
ncbi:MAG: hypothetical protein IJ449_08955 [Clostridia bacterium]|nr:hypothetical protein [Clostridia bacterium]